MATASAACSPTRSRAATSAPGEAGCQRLAEISSGIIDQCVAQGVPFAREYGGSLATRSFGGALVSRTFYARGQTGQQLLYGAYQAMMRQVELGRVKLLTRRDMLELITVDGVARGVVARHLLSGRTGGAHRQHGAALQRWLQQRLLPLDQCAEIQRQCHLARPPQGSPVRQSLLHPDPSHLHPQR